jgi:hypothetical protein
VAAMTSPPSSRRPKAMVGAGDATAAISQSGTRLPMNCSCLRVRAMTMPLPSSRHSTPSLVTSPSASRRPSCSLANGMLIVATTRPSRTTGPAMEANGTGKVGTCLMLVTTKCPADTSSTGGTSVGNGLPYGKRVLISIFSGVLTVTQEPSPSPICLAYLYSSGLVRSSISGEAASAMIAVLRISISLSSARPRSFAVALSRC